MKPFWRRKTFIGHFITQFLGAFNDNFFKNALVLLITYQSISVFGLQSESVVALAGGIFIFPFFIFSSLAGQIADRYEKSRLIQLTKYSELFFMVLAAIGLFFESFSLLLLVLFLMGAQSAFFGPLKYGILPFMVPSHELMKANAFIAATTFVSILIGTILGGLSVSMDQSSQMISLLIILFAVIGILSSRWIEPVDSANLSVKPDWLVITSIKSQVLNALQYKKVFRVILCISFFWFLGAAILSLIPPLVKDILSGNELVSTFFLALFTCGMGIGAFVASRLSGRRVLIGISPISALLMGGCILVISLLSISWPYHPFVPFDLLTFLKLREAQFLTLLFFMMSVFGGMYIVPLMTYLQQNSPRGELSQFIATNNIINSLAMIIAAVLVMALYAFGFVSPQILLILGLLTCAISFLIYAIFSEEAIHFVAKILVKIFYRVEFKGVENIPTQGACILASNHVSYLDWLLIMAATPRPIRFIIDDFFYRLPTMPFWLSQAKLIPITSKKKNEKIYIEAQALIADSLHENCLLGIFPEGAITRNGKLRHFQRGLNDIVEKHRPLVCPVSLVGFEQSLMAFNYESFGELRIKKFFHFFKWRRKMTVIFHPTVEPEDFSLNKLKSSIQEPL